MKPNFSLKYDEIIEQLLQEGSHSFDFKKKNKKQLKKALDRAMKARYFLDRARTIWGKLRVLFYGMYSGILDKIYLRDDWGARWAVRYLEVTCHYVTEVEGKDIDETMARVIFHATHNNRMQSDAAKPRR
jgi:hypothetical protein